ncbi:hypothetical protein FOA52_008385 [Chlamydomonas sp. UWO 241]|nr:hypothetical protein FOA52_008385 [Chlamydomonas sp. UWO 241]
MRCLLGASHPTVKSIIIIIMHGADESYQELQAYAAARSESDGLPFIAPYDDPYTIAGQGTIGDEILRQIGGNVDALDAVFVPIGGGGLIAGIAAYLKALKPSIKVRRRVHFVGCVF